MAKRVVVRRRDGAVGIGANGPEQQQRNYAMVIMQVNDKHATMHLDGPLQRALASADPILLERPPKSSSLI